MQKTNILSAESEEQVKESSNSRRKLVIIGVTIVIVFALALIAILVGVYMFMEDEKDIIQFSLQLKNNMTQDMISNPNTNVVQYHVYQTGGDVWFIDDYNTGLSVMKIEAGSGTNCFVTVLNETDPITIPTINKIPDNTETVAISYTTSANPVPDASFLSSTARDSCKGVSVYWLYPQCDQSTPDQEVNTTAQTVSNHRYKRLNNCNLGSWATYNPYTKRYEANCGSYTYYSYRNFRYTCYYYYPISYRFMLLCHYSCVYVCHGGHCYHFLC